MTVGPWVDRAYVGLLPDVSRFLPETKVALDRAMVDLDRMVGQVGQRLEQRFDRIATGATRSLRQIGDQGEVAFGTLDDQARQAGEGIQRAFQEAHRSSDAALRAIGGPGEFRDTVEQADRAGNAISRSFRSASVSAGVSLGALRARAFGAGAVIASALGVIGTAAIKMGISSVGAFEQAEISFTRLLGSGRKAQKFLEDLNRFAAVTPFELPGLIDAARQLLGAGQAASNVIPIMRALGDATGALGLGQEQFQRIMLATTQVMNKGRLQGEELLQFLEAGIPVWQLLAEATGKPIPKLRELSEKGKLLADDVLPALFRQMEKDYGGSMAKQSRTLNGLFSTFMDTVRNGLREALEPLLPFMREQLPRAGQAAERTIKAVTGFFHDLGAEMGPVRDAWRENDDAILAFVTSLTGARSEAQITEGAASDLADALKFLVEAFGGIADAGNKAGNILDQAQAKLEHWGDQLNQTEFLKNFHRLNKDAWDTAFGFHQELEHGTTVAQDYATAVRDAADATSHLKDALDIEHGAELRVRQAKINVARAQERLTELRKQGRQGTLDYKQAQVTLETAQLALKQATDDYRGAVNRSIPAERAAAHAAEASRGAYDRLKAATIGAGKQITQFSLDSNKAIDKLRGKKLSVTAQYSLGAPQGIELLIEKGLVRAGGGDIRGPGGPTGDRIHVLASDQEHMVAAREVLGLGGGSYQAGHAILEGMRANWRRYATGGPVFAFSERGEKPYLARPPRFDRNVDRSMDASARGFKEWIQGRIGQGVGRIQAFIMSTDPLSYCWGGAGPTCYDCSGLVGSVHLAHLGRPYGHGQRLYTTGSIHAGLAGLKEGLGGILDIGVTAGTGHMAGRYAGLPFEAESTRTGIKVGGAASRPESFARHYHLAGGGRIDARELQRMAAELGLAVGGDADVLRLEPMDQGGWIAPGIRAVWNRSGSLERLLNPDETRAWTAIERVVRATRHQPLAPEAPPVHRTTGSLDFGTIRAIGRAVGDALAERGLGAVYLDGRRAERLLASAATVNARRA